MIIILNGPINSGKSTLARILSRKIPNTAHIEVDEIRKCIDWMEGSEGWKISFKASVQLARGFIGNGLNVIISYHISKEDYAYIVDQLEPYDNNIRAFTLKPQLESLLKNRRERKLNEYEMNKINDTYERDIYGSYGEIIDNTDQTAEETADIIMKIVAT